MSDFCNGIFEKGYEAGKKATEGLSVEDVRKAVMGGKENGLIINTYIGADVVR